jgi:hypothetical protein
LRPRNRVRLEVVVDVGSVARVGRLDMSWDLSCGGQGLRTTPGDLNLRARDVKLWWGAGVMDTKLLDAKEVLAGGDAGRDGDRVRGYDLLLAEDFIFTSFEMERERSPYFPNPTSPVHR